MRRVFILIFTFCSIFLSVTIFLNYSDNIYNSVFENKECVIIEKNEELTNEEFVETLLESSYETNTNILYATIENASAQKPTYNVYTSSIQTSFLNLNTNYKNETIEPNFFLTTYQNSENTKYYVYGSTLYSHFNFYNFSEISELDLTHSKFYIDTFSSNRFLSYITNLGYNVTIIADDNRIEQSETMIELWVMFALLTVFMFFSAICFAYSRRKDIVVKKANGYDEIALFNSTFLKELLLIPILCLTAYFISAFVVSAVYPNSFVDYCGFGIIYELLYILISILLFIIACIYVQFKKNANEIRGNKPSKSLYILAVIFRILVSTVIIWGLTCANDAIIYKHNLSVTQDNFSSVGDQYSVLSLNTGSVDFYNNSEEYMEKCNLFIEEVTQNHEAIIVDSIEFMDSSEDYEKTLYINANYLNINPIYDTNGNEINLKNYSSDEITILLPENYDGQAIEQAIENDI